MNIYIFIGPPGAGKGTTAERLNAKTGAVHFSTGDFIRKHMQDPTSSFGRKAMPYMNRGAYLPDHLMLEGIEGELMSLSADQVILDGFPRSLPQAKELDQLLKSDLQVCPQAILLDIDEEVALQRLLGRRVCQTCGHIYHIKVDPPGREPCCLFPKIGCRKDDTPELARRRLEHYHERAPDLLAYYDKQSRLTKLNAHDDITTVVHNVLQVMEDT